MVWGKFGNILNLRRLPAYQPLYLLHIAVSHRVHQQILKPYSPLMTPICLRLLQHIVLQSLLLIPVLQPDFPASDCDIRIIRLLSGTLGEGQSQEFCHQPDPHVPDLRKRFQVMSFPVFLQIHLFHFLDGHRAKAGKASPYIPKDAIINPFIFQIDDRESVPAADVLQFSAQFFIPQHRRVRLSGRGLDEGRFPVPASHGNLKHII